MDRRQTGDRPAQPPAFAVAEQLLVGSAATGAAAFGVLMLSDLLPVAQFGAVTAMTMVAALITTLLVQSSSLRLGERQHRSAGGRRR